MMRGGRPLQLLVAALLVAATLAQKVIQLDGACTFVNFLNGVRFKEQGATASGAPYYKAKDMEYYIYYDLNCRGTGDPTPRWIVDSDKPSTTADSNLDEDPDCVVLAWVSSVDKFNPPLSATPWQMLCNDKQKPTIEVWMSMVLTLTDIPQIDFPTSTSTLTTLTRTTTSTTPVPEMIRISGSCSLFASFDRQVWFRQGFTKIGAPYFKLGGTAEYYMYFDRDCSGGSFSGPRWIIDNDRPIITRTDDLDADGKCEYQAFVPSSNTIGPPLSASWSMYCGTQFQPLMITIVSVTTTFTTSSTTTSRTTSTTTVSSTSTTSSTTTTTTTGTTTRTTLTQTTTTTTSTDTKTTITSSTSTKTVTTSTRSTSTYSTATVTTMDKATWSEDNGPATVLMLNGVCNLQKYLNGLKFKKIGITASGAPFYKAEKGEFYIYYDPHCNGNVSSAPRWIIDVDAPIANRSSDLDNDGDCNYLARSSIADVARPPMVGPWRVFCTDGWKDLRLYLEEPFVKISNGTCKDIGKLSITDGRSCGDAASYLMLTKQSSQIVPFSGYRALGCYWDGASSELKLATADVYAPQASVSALEPICASGNFTGNTRDAAVSFAATPSLHGVAPLLVFVHLLDASLRSALRGFVAA